MKLLVDIGNSRVKWAVVGDQNTIEAPASSAADDDCWPQALPVADIESIWYASVAAAGAERPLQEWARAHGLAPPQRIVTTARAGGVVNAYDEPSRMGADRWLACIAAHRRARGQSALIVDAGTALTVDYVAAGGCHRGGLITPGVANMRAAIRANTQVRAQEQASGSALLAQDTDGAVARGTLNAALGLIEKAQTELGAQRLYLTGGEASRLAPHLNQWWQSVPALVLEGLALLSQELA